MSHYFDSPSTPLTTHAVVAEAWGQRLELTSASGVFSATRLDPGTAVLFRLCDPPANRPARFLDLGCGFGPIALALAVRCPYAIIDAVDVNQRALDLTRANARRLGVAERVNACLPDTVSADRRYDEIWSNPPIRIGKTALHELLQTWLPRLDHRGQAHLVVGKNLGADSLHTWLEDSGWAVSRVGSAKGFRVLKVGYGPPDSP